MASKRLSCSPSQGRALAIMLPPLALIFHLFILILAISSTPSISSSPAASRFSIYNLVAIGASIAGLIGTLRFNYALISLYTLVHSITLLILTLTLCTNLIPTNTAFPHPSLPLIWFDERSFCKELNGFRGNEQWITRCGARLAILKGGMACAAGLALAAQWWAVVGIWRWGRTLKSNDKEDKMFDTKAELIADVELGYGDEKGDEKYEVIVLGYSDKGVGY